MWVKLTKAKVKDETRTYVQLVESYREGGKPRHRVVASLGRVDELDPEMVARLIRSLSSLTDRVAVVGGPEDVKTSGARVYGSTYVLEKLWEKLGMGAAWKERGSRFDLEAAVRALVFSRLHEPSSERGTKRWLGRAHVQGAEALSLHHLYRALDAFYYMIPRIEAGLLPAMERITPVDASLCLFDTTSVSFEGEGPEGLSRYGYSRSRRPDLRQFILALLTTKEGLPVGHMVLPGNTADTESLIRAKEELLKRVAVPEPIIVSDRGTVSERNLKELEASGYGYIVGVRLRDHKGRHALSVAGRYRHVSENLHVKEVTAADTSRRLIVCLNPEEAKRDKEERERMVAHLEKLLKSSGGIPKKLLRSLAARRYLSISGATVKIDERRMKEDESYDGKWVLETNVPKERLPAQDVALHYKGLWRIERAFRTLKSPLEVHPVYHWTERRVKAHVGVCVLAYAMLTLLELLLHRGGLSVSGEEALHSLSAITREEVTVGPLTFWVRSELTAEHERILSALGLPIPPKGGRLERHG